MARILEKRKKSETKALSLHQTNTDRKELEICHQPYMSHSPHMSRPHRNTRWLLLCCALYFIDVYLQMLYSAVFSCVVCETRQLLVLPTTAIKMSPMLSMQQICQLWPVQQCHYYSNKCYVKSPTTISHVLHLLFTAAKTLKKDVLP